MGIAQEHRFADSRTCILTIEFIRKRFRQLVVNVVMAADIMDPDMMPWRKKRWEKVFHPSLSSDTFLLDIDVDRKATIVMQIIQALAGVEHTMQYWHIFFKWSTKLNRELYRAFTMACSAHHLYSVDLPYG